VCYQEDSQFPNLRSSAAIYLLHGNTARAGQHRLIRSAPSRPADVAVAQNDLRPSCATGPSPVAHPASRSMTSPAPSVTVMIRSDLLLMRPSPETGDRWAKQSRHMSQMDRFHKRGEELAVAAPARPSGCDGVMASSPQPRRRWLLEGAGAAFHVSARADSLRGHVCDQAEHCPIRPRAWTDSQVIGGGHRGR
jgi:hypothetical protein